MRIARGISVTNTSKPISTAIVYDADAAAFFTAASITDTTQKNAVNTLVLSLKSANIWTKMKALYPVVGGVASSHAINLKTPGTYNLTFATGWTHASTGMTPNGATYADTFLTPSTALQLNNSHISGYLRTNFNSDAPILSSENSSTYQNGLYIWPKRTSLGFSIRINDDTSDSGGTNSDNILGLHLLNRTLSNSKKYFLNNTIRLNSTTISTGLNTSSIYIGASRNNANYFNNQIAFSSIGNGLTDAEASAFYTAVQTYQTTLGRQV